MSGTRPVVLIMGAGGTLGSALAAALGRNYRVVGLDRHEGELAGGVPVIAADITSDEKLAAALKEVRRRFGGRIASVIHLAAYFDFSGEDNELYRTVNIEGTRRLLRALQEFEIGQFVYSGTMLVHRPCRPGERIDESQPIEPKWVYPKSKADAEAAIRQEHGGIPIVLLHLAGLYDERTAVPTLAQQIARIYERTLQSKLYSGDPTAGQSMLHKEDMIDAFRRVVDRRAELPREVTLLIGEPEAMGYDEIQDAIGKAIHGEQDWPTIEVPKPLAKAGAWAQGVIEPIVPDAFDQGEKPFIRPFMVDMADDHYALDIAAARRLLGWEPRRRLADELPMLVAALKEDPAAWYRENKITPPPWIEAADKAGHDPEALRRRHESQYLDEHRRFRWAHLANIFMGFWLAASPPLIGLEGALLISSDVAAGLAIMILSAIALEPRRSWARWTVAAIGIWVMSAAFIFWTPNGMAYLNDTLVGGLVVAFAVGTPPEPGPSPLAAASGPAVPSGWDYNPSAWTQRLPIIALAVIGLLTSRYLAAYQLGHIDSVWEPFFAGGPDPKNGTEEIITSEVSRAWPVPDAAVGALTYALEIVTGIVGSTRRWRTMPWLVLLFGLMIVPLGVVSITFIVIQPIVIGTWCTLCLIAAAAMLIQIPYSLDELLATLQFLRRRQRAGRKVLRILVFGDTDEGTPPPAVDNELDRPLPALAREMVAGGVSLPWNMAICAAIGVWLMLSRLALDTGEGTANAHHVIGALVLTTTAIAAAEVARPVRLLNCLWGIALISDLFLREETAMVHTASVIAGLALCSLSLFRGPVRSRYAGWSRLIV
ncbi:MAG: NAD-dependent epimerase/dehydratase family protein [Alphaproteobacteria bacterium]|nr:NAD-dependent epimerase/dehydratase family protein [Alphaproteobacteria bacterium]MCW5744327.1 NAD-dependent epimerase/dehydratase family protein [Alphaproteobacteria bacterium]